MIPSPTVSTSQIRPSVCPCVNAVAPGASLAPRNWQARDCSPNVRGSLVKCCHVVSTWQGVEKAVSLNAITAVRVVTV